MLAGPCLSNRADPSYTILLRSVRQEFKMELEISPLQDTSLRPPYFCSLTPSIRTVGLPYKGTESDAPNLSTSSWLWIACCTGLSIILKPRQMRGTASAVYTAQKIETICVYTKLNFRDEAQAKINKEWSCVSSQSFHLKQYPKVRLARNWRELSWMMHSHTSRSLNQIFLTWQPKVLLLMLMLEDYHVNVLSVQANIWNRLPDRIFKQQSTIPTSTTSELKRGDTGHSLLVFLITIQKMKPFDRAAVIATLNSFLRIWNE
jgi:hypothetical protein